MSFHSVHLQEKNLENLFTRRSMYQVLSACFLYPTESRFSFFKEIEFIEFVNKIDDCYKNVGHTAGMGTGLMRLLVSLEKTTINELQSIYLKDAGHVISRGCPLSEGQHGQTPVFQKARLFADVHGFDDVSGLDSPVDKEEKSKHITAELQFMQYLLYNQAYAMEKHGKERALILLNTQNTFLKEQMGDWIHLFGILSERQSQRGFYYELANVAQEFMKWEMKLYEIETGRNKEPVLTHKMNAGVSHISLSCSSMNDKGKD